VADGKGARDGARAAGTDPHRRAARRSRAQRVAAGAGPRTNSRGARHCTDAVSLAPDYAGPLIGWRTWAVVEEAGGLMLRSTVYPSRWPPGQRLVAACANSARFGVVGRVPPIEAHEAPSEGCGCGIYAARSPELALRYLGRVGLLRGDKAALIGQVALWGRVIEYEHGWRGALAYPKRLYLPRARPSRRGRNAHELALALAGYAVPVEVVEERTMGALLSALVAAEDVVSSAT
jgi:hypothetical protein